MLQSNTSGPMQQQQQQQYVGQQMVSELHSCRFTVGTS
jgi:hypothetical protein